ncbi:hypothetical protein D3C85_1094400 [compost metagenome]
MVSSEKPACSASIKFDLTVFESFTMRSYVSPRGVQRVDSRRSSSARSMSVTSLYPTLRMMCPTAAEISRVGCGACHTPPRNTGRMRVHDRLIRLSLCEEILSPPRMSQVNTVIPA